MSKILEERVASFGIGTVMGDAVDSGVFNNPEYCVTLANYYAALARLAEVGMEHMDEACLDEHVDPTVLRTLIDSIYSLSQGMYEHEIV